MGKIPGLGGKNKCSSASKITFLKSRIGSKKMKCINPIFFLETTHLIWDVWQVALCSESAQSFLSK
jgi:hypothetical protein